MILLSSGYHNKVLRVDLTKGRTRIEHTDDRFYKVFLGGAGMGAKILLDEVPSHVDPFQPANKVVFATGPFQSTRIPGSAKWSLISKSPMTHTFGDSAAGASFGPSLRGCGLDAIVVEGRSPSPVYLWIEDGAVELRDASALWGLETFDTIDAMKSDTSKKASVAAIGPAGERLVRFACVVVDKHSYAGRSGIGAVLGSKKFKGIALSGSATPSFFDGGALDDIRKDITRTMARSDRGKELRAWGTPGGFATYNALDNTPKKNWDGSSWTEEGKEMETPHYNEALNVKPKACISCPLACHRHVSFEHPSYGVDGPGPEYETLAMLGANCLVREVRAVAKANDLCNRYGMDTISAGSAIALAMEAYEKGWIPPHVIGDLRIDWGDPAIVLHLIDLIGKREGIGSIMAEGAATLGATLGKEGYAVHVRGLDVPGHDPRLSYSLSVNYATGTRGACHYRGCPEETEIGGFLLPEYGVTKKPRFFEVEDKTRLAVIHQNFGAIMGSAVLCAFMFVEGEASISRYLDALNAMTGWGWSFEDLSRCGERIYNFQRLVNIRDGKGPAYDVLPKKLLTPAPDGARMGKAPPFDDMMQECYKLRGWTKEGYPTREMLASVGIEPSLYEDHFDLATMKEVIK